MKGMVRSNWIVGRFDKLWEKLVGAQRGAFFRGIFDDRSPLA